MKFKIGDRVKWVKLLNPEANASIKPFIGKNGVISDFTNCGGSYTVKFDEVILGYITQLPFYEAELELVQGEKEMSAKFKVGDLVKVTASKEELKAINATECFEKVGAVVLLEPLVFKFTFNIPNEGIGQYFLNYAHAELVESEQAPKFKAGDLVRWNGTLYEIEKYGTDGSIWIYPPTRKYDLSVVTELGLEPVTDLKVGDRIVLNPVEVEITDVGEDTSDSRYEVIFPNGLQMSIPNELVPTAKVQEKIEVGSIVMVTPPDSKKQVFGQVTRDDQDCSGRYRVEYILDNKKDYNYFSGNDLTKIPKELFPDIKEVLGD